MANEFVNLYNREGVAGSRADALKAYHINQAIESAGDIASMIFKVAQQKEAMRLKKAELATTEDIRKHNATTLLLGTVGQKALGQEGLLRYEDTLRRVTGQDEFVFPRNKEGMIEIPEEFEKQLQGLLLDEKGSLNEAGRAMYAASVKKPTPFQEGMDDLRNTIREFGADSPEASIALSALEKATLPSMSQQQARDWLTIPQAQRIQRLLKGNDTTIKLMNISPAEREKVVANRAMKDQVNSALKGLKSFVKKHGDVFGRFNVKGWKLSANQFFQTPWSKDIRGDFRRTIAPIYRAQSAQIKEMVGTAQTFGETINTEPWTIKPNDDLTEIVNKVKSAGEELEIWRRRRQQAGRNVRGMPEFGDVGDVGAGEDDSASLLEALRQSGGLENLSEDELAVLGE